MSLSEATRAARELGYTEPDPRDDLSGMDVARKLLIWSVKPAASWNCRISLLNRCCPPGLTTAAMSAPL